ncbi:MAG TPA: hypothetical protein VMV32_11295 [Ignavibacteriaceae bacterium]|nr:hypothetical protein [Ignavibacteriaceae bacterium]
MIPSITDWIQAFGVLIGIPVVIWSIISLFRKDIEKEKQLNSLNSIALSQNTVVLKLSEQVEQLTIQSSHFQYQNSLMIEANEIMKKQLELHYEIFNHGKDAENKRVDIERSKRISEIKPYFIMNGSQASPESFKLDLENKGGDAKNLKITELETKFAWFQQIPEDFNIEKSNVFSIYGGPNANNTYYNAHNVTFEINLEFEDIDGHSYYQNIKRLQTEKYIINEPKIKESAPTCG